jgi:hypothetical protein
MHREISVCSCVLVDGPLQGGLGAFVHLGRRYVQFFSEVLIRPVIQSHTISLDFPQNLGKSCCNAPGISVTVISAEMIVSAHRYRLVASLAGFVLALLYPLVATGNARADDLNPAADPAINSALQAAGELAGSGDADTTAPVDEPVPAATGQTASTDQGASSTAQATQQFPRNTVVSIRINSPGNDGPISQTNVAGSGAGASNDSSTAQGAAYGAQQGAEQQATTDQGATATATATQEQPQNIVILIRINSPGDNGSIEQTNTTVAVSNSGNVSVTTQGEPGKGGADGAATDTSPDPRAPIGPPAQQATTAAGAAPRTAVAERAPAAPKRATATEHPIDRKAPAASTTHRPSGGDRANSAPSSNLSVASESSNPPAAVRSGAREPLAHMKPDRRSLPVRSAGAVSGDPGVGRRAVDFLGRLADPSPVQASRSDKDVSNAVVLTLIAVLGAFVVFCGSTYLSSGRRLFGRRSWRHG